MQMINVDELKPHSKNDYFFDDIQGDNWEEFKKSVKTSGVIEPIVITQEKIIVSGHQRTRACKELGIKEIPCRVHIYEDEDKVLKDLIETNIRQRGMGNPNPIKFGRCIAELEKLYGIRQGSAGKRSLDLTMSNPKTQKELSEDLGVDQTQLIRYKNLLNLIPELQELVQTGKISSSAGSRIWAKMPPEEQEKFFNDIGKDKISEMTQKQTQQYIEEKRQLEEENQQLKELYYKEKNNVKEKIIDNTDYDLVDRLQNNAQLQKQNYNQLHNDYKKKISELNQLQQQIKTLTESKEESQYVDELEKNVLLFCAKSEKFIKEVGGLAYLSNHLKELSPDSKKAYLKCVELVNAWAVNVMKNSEQYLG